jgi:hypothetical protein
MRTDILSFTRQRETSGCMGTQAERLKTERSSIALLFVNTVDDAAALDLK